MMAAERKPFPWGAGILLLLATVAAVAAGAVISSSRNDAWYSALSKPALTPPDYLFSLVWPVLFVLMAAGALMVLERAGTFERAVSPLGIYYTMLAVNAFWSLAFFGMQDTALALGVIAALWLLIIAMIQDFARFSRPAALLQFPYLIWVSFAIYLNLSILAMNSDS
ncbi:hypothetical protein HY11_09000 [Hyphomonas pacifica]|nr:hypothetical protein HY11_09000 [Hyphomonas pacifica]